MIPESLPPRHGCGCRIGYNHGGTKVRGNPDGEHDYDASPLRSFSRSLPIGRRARTSSRRRTPRASRWAICITSCATSKPTSASGSRSAVPVRLVQRHDGRHRFPDVVVLLRQGEPTGGTARLRRQSRRVSREVARRDRERRASRSSYNEQYPGVASVHTPEGERIELFDDELATNLGFTIDGGGRRCGRRAAQSQDRRADHRASHSSLRARRPSRRRRRIGTRRTSAAYAANAGATTPSICRASTQLLGRRREPSAPTRGRALDHIGFEVDESRSVLQGARGRGHQARPPYAKLPSGFGLAFLTDPWGTYIELTEGLRAL